MLYHIDLLVFCRKFRLVLFCEYLNYYYNITHDCWVIPGEIQAVGFDDFFGKNMVYHFILENSRQNKALSLQIPWNCVAHLGNSKAKNEDLWKFNVIFSSSILEIPLLFQLTPGISTWYFFNIRENSVLSLYTEADLGLLQHPRWSAL